MEIPFLEGCAFINLLREMHAHIRGHNYHAALHTSSNFQNLTQDQSIELKSLTALAKIHVGHFGQATQLLNQCLECRPTHSLSYRRKGFLLEKQGLLPLAVSAYRMASYYEPDNRSLAHKIASLQADIATKTYQKTISQAEQADGQNIQSHTDSKHDQGKNKEPQVKFGNFEVIEPTQNSDEHFAILQHEISTLAHKKPKKSILKGSMSTFSTKKKNSTGADSSQPDSLGNGDACCANIKIKQEDQSYSDKQSYWSTTKIKSDEKKKISKSKSLSFCLGPNDLS